MFGLLAALPGKYGSLGVLAAGASAARPPRDAPRAIVRLAEPRPCGIAGRDPKRARSARSVTGRTHACACPALRDGNSSSPPSNRTLIPIVYVIPVALYPETDMATATNWVRWAI